MRKINHPVLNDIYKQVWRKKRNSMIAVVGEVGTGKSTLALHLAQILDETFTPESNGGVRKLLNQRLVTSALELSKIMAEDKLRKGQAIIFDEAGAGDLDAYNWMKKEAKNIAHMFQIHRYRQLFTIFTLPNISMLVKSTRKLLNYLFECKNIEFGEKLTAARPKVIETATYSGDMYKKIPRYQINGQTYVYEHMWFGLPDEDLMDAYEEIMKEKKDEIIQRAYKKMKKEKKEQKEKKEEIDLDELAEKIVEKVKNNEMEKITKIRILEKYPYITDTQARILNVKAKRLQKRENSS